MVTNPPSNAGVRVPSLVRELRPQMPCVVAKKGGGEGIKISFFRKKKKKHKDLGKQNHTHTHTHTRLITGSNHALKSSLILQWILT